MKTGAALTIFTDVVFKIPVYLMRDIPTQGAQVNISMNEWSIVVSVWEWKYGNPMAAKSNALPRETIWTELYREVYELEDRDADIAKMACCAPDTTVARKFVEHLFHKYVVNPSIDCPNDHWLSVILPDWHADQVRSCLRHRESLVQDVQDC